MVASNCQEPVAKPAASWPGQGDAQVASEAQLTGRHPTGLWIGHHHGLVITTLPEPTSDTENEPSAPMIGQVRITDLKKCTCQNNRPSDIPIALWIALVLSLLILGICLVGGLTTTLLDGNYGLSLAMLALTAGGVMYISRVAKEYLEYREMAARLARQTCECGGANENASRAYLSKGPLRDPDELLESGVPQSNHGPMQDRHLDAKV